MKISKPTFVMATICLNFSYGPSKAESPIHNQFQLYRYSFLEFKSGHTPSHRVKKHSRGKTITVINYTVEQLFALAFGAGTSINQEQTIIDVIDRKKLQEMRCYKLFVPQQQIDNFYGIMQQNLNMEFPEYKIKIEPIGNEKYMIITDQR